MGNFWDDLNNFLGGVSDKPSSTKMWDELLGATANAQPTPLIEGIQPESMAPIVGTRPEQSPFYQSTDDINAQVALNPVPFQMFDVNPMDYYGNTANKCSIDLSVLQKLFGLESALSGLGTGDSIGNWRTVQINFSGTFFKFEYRNAGLNPLVISTHNPSQQNIANFFPYLGGNTAGTIGVPILAGQRVVLVQFGSNKASPIILNSGDVIKAPFQTAFVTFKYFGAPFRVTVGQKTEISSDSDNRTMNASIAFGPGYGLWEQSQVHAVPFCFTPDNFQNAGLSAIFTLGAGGSTTFNLITNDKTVAPVSGYKCPDGSAILWITDSTFSCTATVATTVYVTFALVVVNSALGIVRTVCEAMGSAGNANADRISFSSSFPPRVTLRQGETLALYAKENGGAAGANMSWMIRGYIMGGLVGAANQTYAANGTNSLRGQYAVGTTAVNCFPQACFDIDAFPDDVNSSLFTAQT